MTQIILRDDLCDYNNILFYGSSGLPHDVILATAFEKKYGTSITTTPQTFKKDILYTENPYYFTIDMNNPSQCKDIEEIANFIKVIVSHTSVHSPKHIFIVYGIEKLFVRNSVYAFRVLLEKYSNNVLFIGSTYAVSKIEAPIRSRFLNVRVPLLSPQEVNDLLTQLNLHVPDGFQERNLYKALFAAWVYTTKPGVYPELQRSVPQLRNLPNTAEQVRELANKVYVNNVSIADLAFDFMLATDANSIKGSILSMAARLDALSACTDGHRMPLYIETLIHYACDTIHNGK